MVAPVDHPSLDTVYTDSKRRCVLIVSVMMMMLIMVVIVGVDCGVDDDDVMLTMSAIAVV